MEMNQRWRSVKRMIFYFFSVSGASPYDLSDLKNSNRKLSFTQAQTHFLEPSSISSGADLGGQKDGTTKGFSQQTQPSCDPAAPPRRKTQTRGLPTSPWGGSVPRHSPGGRHLGAAGGNGRAPPSRRSALGAIEALGARQRGGGGRWCVRGGGRRPWRRRSSGTRGAPSRMTSTTAAMWPRPASTSAWVGAGDEEGPPLPCPCGPWFPGDSFWRFCGVWGGWV